MEKRNVCANTGPAGTEPVVLWSVYEADGRVHAVADVPQCIPKGQLGYGVNSTEASVFFGTPAARQWAVTLPVTVNPTPVSISYNNGIFEAVFTVATDAPLTETSD
jgi:hypothetical protein